MSEQSLLDTAKTTHRFATCWKIERTDGIIFRFTTHNVPLLVFGDIYTPTGGFNTNAIKTEEGLKSTDTSFRGVISSDIITDSDIFDGKYRDAKITEYLVDWRYSFADPIQTIIYWITSIEWTGEIWDVKVNGLTSWLNQVVGRTYTRNCGYDLGDARKCRVDTAQLQIYGLVTEIIIPRKKFRVNILESDITQSLKSYFSPDNTSILDPNTVDAIDFPSIPLNEKETWFTRGLLKWNAISPKQNTNILSDFRLINKSGSNIDIESEKIPISNIYKNENFIQCLGFANAENNGFFDITSTSFDTNTRIHKITFANTNAIVEIPPPISAEIRSMRSLKNTNGDWVFSVPNVNVAQIALPSSVDISQFSAGDVINISGFTGATSPYNVSLSVGTINQIIGNLLIYNDPGITSIPDNTPASNTITLDIQAKPSNVIGSNNEIKEWTLDDVGGGGIIELQIESRLDITVNDSFIVTPGCNKLRSTCINKFNNIKNFGGFVTIPGTDKTRTG